MPKNFGQRVEQRLRAIQWSPILGYWSLFIGLVAGGVAVGYGATDKHPYSGSTILAIACLQLVLGMWYAFKAGLRIKWVLTILICAGFIVADYYWIASLYAPTPEVILYVKSHPSIAAFFAMAMIAIAFLSLRFQKISVILQLLMDKKMIVYVPIILGVAFCVWGYYVASTVYYLNREVRHQRIALRRFLEPRELTEEQIDSIGEYLSHFDRQQVVMRVVKNDNEAGNYRSDLERAIGKAGWVVSESQYADDIQEGLGIQLTEPYSEPASPPDPFERLNPKKKPSEILAEALRHANVQIDRGGGGSGRGITKTTITIEIGHRRRDKFAIIPSRFLKGGRQIEPYDLTDDDFEK